MDLTNASGIVTGGAGGFGSATVRRLAERKGAICRSFEGSLTTRTVDPSLPCAVGNRLLVAMRR
jgi:NAD(P)-dependent dehydrogenase (short-subunit alcohol dehydrogenase family)